MTQPKQLKCQNCGAVIDRRTMRCEYCDTQYEREVDGTMVRFAVERQGVCTIRAKAIIDEHMALHHPEEATKSVEAQLRRSLADGLLDYMRCETKYDPMRMVRIIRGEVRVVEPTFADYRDL